MQKSRDRPLNRRVQTLPAAECLLYRTRQSEAESESESPSSPPPPPPPSSLSSQSQRVASCSALGLGIGIGTGTSATVVTPSARPGPPRRAHSFCGDALSKSTFALASARSMLTTTTTTALSAPGDVGAGMYSNCKDGRRMLTSVPLERTISSIGQEGNRYRSLAHLSPSTATTTATTPPLTVSIHSPVSIHRPTLIQCHSNSSIDTTFAVSATRIASPSPMTPPPPPLTAFSWRRTEYSNGVDPICIDDTNSNGNSNSTDRIGSDCTSDTDMTADDVDRDMVDNDYQASKGKDQSNNNNIICTGMSPTNHDDLKDMDGVECVVNSVDDMVIA